MSRLPTTASPPATVESAFVSIRGQKVVLAALYCVEVKVLNQAVKRNHHRFPADFMFELVDDWAALRLVVEAAVAGAD